MILRSLLELIRDQSKISITIGFSDLWCICPDTEGIAQMLFRLFLSRTNYLQSQNPYIYFLLPEGVTFNPGTHLYLRLSPHLYADMTAVFGQMAQISSDHYHHNFTVSQV